MPLRAGFQSQVSTLPAPGVEGDFCDLNPFYHYPAGPGGLVAGTSMISGVSVAGVTVGRWAWAANTFFDPDGGSQVVNCFGTGAPLGLVPRRQQGFITLFLYESSLVIPTGLALGIVSAGDMWVVNRGTTQAYPGQFALPNFADGSTSFGTAATTGASSTSAGSIAPETFTVTGTITGNVFAAVSGLTGSIYPGSILSGTNVATGTTITAQLTGTANGLGTYQVNIGEQAATSTTVTGAYGLFTAGTVTGGSFGVGDVLTGTGVTAGTVITVILTGTGGTSSTMVVNPSQTVTGNAISVLASNYLSGWKVASQGNPGELVKIYRLP